MTTEAPNIGPRLIVELNWFAPISDDQSPLVRCAEFFRRECLEPILERLESGLYLAQHTRWPPGGSATRGWSHSQKSWAGAMEELGAGRTGTFALIVARRSEGEGDLTPLVDQLTFTIDLEGPEEFGTANRVSVRCAPASFTGNLQPDMQERFVSFLTFSARELAAATGLITVDYESAQETPFERWIGRGAYDGLRESAEWLRGYYWGTILGPEHMRKLGGLERVKREAPCFRVEDLSSDEERAYLQLTSDLRDVPREQLRALRDFLLPALPSGTPDNTYIGPDLQLAEE